MDYTQQPLGFQVRKALRYIRLYGVKRTLVKAQSYYHMNKRFRTLPDSRPERACTRHVGLLGCGKFAYSSIAYYLTRNFGDVIRWAMDTDIHRAASLSQKYGLPYYTKDAENVLSDPSVDLIYIASNHASHAEYAIDALKRGHSVHIEKPHVVNEDQLKRLCAAMESSSGRVALGFNRPHSPIGREIKRRLDDETGPSVFNWFVVGHKIPPDHWYHREEEGGRVLGNLCHWTDFVYQMVPPDRRFPIEINPTRAKQRDCDIAVTFAFGDGSIAAITFSERGHFEGVKERFAAQRGSTLIVMDDFMTLAVDIVDTRHRMRMRFRDHGLERSITDSYTMLGANRRPDGRPSTSAYVWETGQLFLKTKQALEERRTITVGPFERSRDLR
jgi:predicted dehydrogenase